MCEVAIVVQHDFHAVLHGYDELRSQDFVHLHDIFLLMIVGSPHDHIIQFAVVGQKHKSGRIPV